MRYEIHFGGFTHWCEAATPLQAGIKTLQACIDEWKTFPQMPFNTINLETGAEEMVGLSEVVNTIALAAEYDPDLPEPPFNADSDLGRAMGLIVLEPAA